MTKTFINIKKSTPKQDIEIMEDIASLYDYTLELLQSHLKLNNVYVMLTNYDVRTNNSQIYRVEHRKRTMIKINFEEMIESFVTKEWKHRYSREFLPKKMDTDEHALFILLHEISHYVRKDHLSWAKGMSELDQKYAEFDCDIRALKYLELFKSLRSLNDY